MSIFKKKDASKEKKPQETESSKAADTEIAKIKEFREKFSKVETMSDYNNLCREIRTNVKPEEKADQPKTEEKANNPTKPVDFVNETPKQNPSEYTISTNDSDEIDEVAFGLIKPFFTGVPVDPTVKPKKANFETQNAPSATATQQPTIIPFSNVAATALKGDMVANAFCDRIGILAIDPKREMVRVPIAETVKKIDENPNNIDNLTRDLYQYIGSTLGFSPNDKSCTIISNFFREVYEEASKPMVPVIPNIPVGNLTQPKMAVDANEDPKITSAFKKAREVATRFGFHIKVTPFNGLYRADVYNSVDVFDKDRSFWADLDGKIMNRKNKWFPVSECKQGLSFEDYSIFSMDEVKAFAAHFAGEPTKGCPLINSPTHVAKNRFVDLITMPDFGADVETRNAVNDILDRSMKAKLFKSDSVTSKNRYRIIEANKNRIVMQNDAPIRYGYQVDPSEKHILLTIRVSDGEATVGTW